MKQIRLCAILLGFLICGPQIAHAQQPQQKPAVPSPPRTTSTAIAVAPLQNGESAVWIATEDAVFYCVHRPAPEPEKSPAGGIQCTGGRIPVLPRQ
jgi:hypothetical protein